MASRADVTQQTSLDSAKVSNKSQIAGVAVAVILGVIVQLMGNSAQNVASPTILRKFATVEKTLPV
jgi:hypothetical protein